MKPNLLIFTVPYDLIPFEKTFKLISMEDTRFLHCNTKTLNLIPNVIAYQHCIEAPFTTEELRTADEVIISRSGGLCTSHKSLWLILLFCIPVKINICLSLLARSEIDIRIETSNAKSMIHIE